MMKIQEKLISAFIAVSLLVSVVGIIGLYANNHIVNTFEGGEKHFGAIIEASNEVSSYAKRAQGHLMLFLTLNNEMDREKFYQRMASLREQNSIIEAKVTNPDAMKVVYAIKSETDNLSFIGESLLKAYDNETKKTGKFDFEAHEGMLRKLDSVAAGIRNNGLELTKIELALQEEQQNKALLNAVFLYNIILIIIVAAVASALSLGYFMARNISNPIKKLNEAAINITKGNLGERITIKSKDEIGELADSFNNMSQQMQKSLDEHIKNEEAIRESEERYRKLIDLSPDGVGIAVEGKIVFMNRVGAKILENADPDQLLGKSVNDLLHKDYQDRIKHPGIEKTVPSIEEKYTRQDGTSVDIEVAAVGFQYQGKQALLYVFRDITQRKKADEIKHENLRLEAANGAKSEFLATMSHELRTPLNSSIGFSQLLKDGTPGELNEKQKRYVDNILSSNQFLLTLINDILDLSKIEAGKIELVPEKMSVPLTIKETLSLIKEKAMKHNVLLNTEFDPAVDYISADKQRFKQILFNLLSNAVKFSKEEGGTITIKAKKAGDLVHISVSDTGIGIKEENLGKLFRKFEQLAPEISGKYGGTGLGLAITKQLVDLHGGKIWAESKYGEGTKFTFTLPIMNNNEKSAFS